MKPERLEYLRTLAEDYDVELVDVVRLAIDLGEDEDYDGLVDCVNNLSDPGA